MCDQVIFVVMVFFFKQKTAYEMRISDWSSDVCSSDLSTATYGHATAVLRDTTFAGCGRFCITPARYAVTLDRPFIASISGTCDAVRGNRHHGHIASPFREPLMSATLYNWLESGLTGWGLGAIALYFLLVTQIGRAHV